MNYYFDEQMNKSIKKLFHLGKVLGIRSISLKNFGDIRFHPDEIVYEASDGDRFLISCTRNDKYLMRISNLSAFNELKKFLEQL